MPFRRPELRRASRWGPLVFLLGVIAINGIVSGRTFLLLAPLVVVATLGVVSRILKFYDHRLSAARPSGSVRTIRAFLLTRESRGSHQVSAWPRSFDQLGAFARWIRHGEMTGCIDVLRTSVVWRPTTRDARRWKLQPIALSKDAIRNIAIRSIAPSFGPLNMGSLLSIELQDGSQIEFKIRETHGLRDSMLVSSK